jgi:hypothetical protein
MKIELCIFVLGLSFLLIVGGGLMFYDRAMQILTLPTLNLQFQRYHNTSEMIYRMKNENHNNPFYGAVLMNRNLEEGEQLVSFESLSDLNEKKLRVMIVCGQHGRELVTAEVCFALTRLLQLQAKDVDLIGPLMKLVEQNVGFYILPVMNPHARQMIERDRQTFGCKRTNHHDVDLNRNFPFIRQPPRSYRLGNPGEENYAGPYPLSEFETVLTQKWVQTIQPHLLIVIHSGLDAILLPYDAFYIPMHEHYTRMLRIANLAKHQTCPQCKIGQSSVLLYESYGTLVDAALDLYDVDIALTLEIFGNTSIKSTNEDGDSCFHYFNPNEGHELASVVKRWVKFLIVFVEKTLIRLKKK